MTNHKWPQGPPDEALDKIIPVILHFSCQLLSTMTSRGILPTNLPEGGHRSLEGQRGLFSHRPGTIVSAHWCRSFTPFIAVNAIIAVVIVAAVVIVVIIVVVIVVVIVFVNAAAVPEAVGSILFFLTTKAAEAVVAAASPSLPSSSPPPPSSPSSSSSSMHRCWLREEKLKRRHHCEHQRKQQRHKTYEDGDFAFLSVFMKW
jgi:hypothetical protein